MGGGAQNTYHLSPERKKLKENTCTLTFFEETKKSVFQGSGILAEDDLDWCKSGAKSKFGFDLGPLLAVFALSGETFAKH